MTSFRAMRVPSRLPDGAAVVPGNADEPGNRRKDETQDLAQAGGDPVHVVESVCPAEHAVKQRDQG